MKKITAFVLVTVLVGCFKHDRIAPQKRAGRPSEFTEFIQKGVLDLPDLGLDVTANDHDGTTAFWHPKSDVYVTIWTATEEQRQTYATSKFRPSDHIQVSVPKDSSEYTPNIVSNIFGSFCLTSPRDEEWLVPFELDTLTNIAIIGSWLFERRNHNGGPLVFAAFYRPSHVERELHYKGIVELFEQLRNSSELRFHSTEDPARRATIVKQDEISQIVAIISQHSYFEPFTTDDCENTSEIEAFGGSFESLILTFQNHGHLVLAKIDNDEFCFSLSQIGRKLLAQHFSTGEEKVSGAKK